MNSRQTVVMIGIIALVLAISAWLLANFERTTITVRSGYTTEALRNPWLAAQRLIERMGGKAATVSNPSDLHTLPPSATLVLPAERHSLSPALLSDLLAWLHRGGYLIVEGEAENLLDPLVDALGVRRAAMRPSRGGRAPGQPLEIKLPGSDTTSRVILSRRMRLEAGDSAFAFDPGNGNVLVLVESGDGLALVLNELEFATNRDIGDHQHAQFLWAMLAMVPGDRPVYFFNAPARQSFAGWLARHAWAPLCGLAALVLAWLWHAAPRFGPMAPDPVRSRRRLLDHLRASGRYLWSNGGAQRMLDAARDACLRRIARAHPDFLALPEAERPRRLAEILGWPEERARQLMAPPNATRMADFLHAVHLYQSAHEQLSARNPSRKRR